MEVIVPSVRKRGRPPSFDRDEALDRAMRLFWRHGYEATSIRDLQAATGLTPPSIYAAFGDKKRLFRAAVDRYLGGPSAPATAIGTAPSAREAAAQLLEAALLGDTGQDTPPGCLLATATISCAPEATDLQAEGAAIRHGIEAALRDRIGAEVTSGAMPADTDADGLAGHVMAVVQGMSTLARDGADRAKLRRVAATAMLAWP